MRTTVMPFEHDTAVYNGPVIHYVRAGAGDPAVLLHGWPATWHHWRKLIPGGRRARVGN